jgi:ribose/xylose/arabinose/galactoside ABC-type transport system permease subunit
MIRRLPRSAYVLAVLFVVAALIAPRFFTTGNLVNVARVAAILSLAAYGQSIAVVTGGLDFSMGSSVALVSVVTVLLVSSVGTPIAFAAGALSAVAVGIVNGFLISRLEMPPFLVTLGILIAVYGLASLLVGGIPLQAPADVQLDWLGQGALLGVPVPIIVSAAGFFALSVLMGRTRLGRSWYLIGSSQAAARNAGIPVRRYLFLAYLVSSLFVAAAGAILTSRVNSGQPNLHPTLPFEAIAACAIGGLALTGGVGRPLQVLIGVLVVAIVNNAVVLLNLSSAMQLMAIGVLTVAAVLFQQFTWRAAQGRRRGTPEPWTAGGQNAAPVRDEGPA